jgi:hypothetical protein
LTKELSRASLEAKEAGKSPRPCETTLSIVSFAVLRWTTVGARRYFSKIVTVFPPEIGPFWRERCDGRGASWLKRSAALLEDVPSPVVTVTSTLPDPFGAVT